MQQHGWTLLFHDNLIEQMMKLRAAVLRAQESDPQGFGSNANVKFFRALVELIQDVVPSDPARDEYRQGNTMGPAWRHWRRAKLGRRYRLFFRYDSKAKVIVYAWVNDEQTLRSSGSKSDPLRGVRENARTWKSARRLERIGTGKQAGLEQTGIGIPPPAKRVGCMVPRGCSSSSNNTDLGTSALPVGHSIYQFEPAGSGFCWMSADEDRLKIVNPDNYLRGFLASGGSSWKVEVERVMGTSSCSQLVD